MIYEVACLMLMWLISFGPLLPWLRIRDENDDENDEE